VNFHHYALFSVVSAKRATMKVRRLSAVITEIDDPAIHDALP
jgi:hypothetical protein